MYNIKHEMIVWNYDGEINEHHTKLVIGSIIRQLETIGKTKLKGILISLKAVNCDNRQKEIAMLVKQLDGLSQKAGVIIGLSDYSVAVYQLLKVITQNTKVKLFKNINSANLFLDPKSFKQGLKVLLYDEDYENSKKLSQELSKYGYSIIQAKDAKNFQSLLHAKQYEMVITHSALNMNLNSTKTSKKSILKLSKKLIANLPVFMDTAVETLISFTGLEAEKSAHSIKPFDINLKSNIVCAVMKFKGDVEGSFVLVFPTDIALIAMEALLGEMIDESDTESIMDGVGEFCNIITGSTKTALSKKDIKVLFELPRTYTSLKSVMDDIGNNSGIWIDMQLAGKPFYMFITK